jgi:hypothetical protein
MTARPISAAPRRLLPAGLLQDLARHEPVLVRFAVLMLLLMVPTLAALSFDTRTYNGVNVA